MKQAAQQSQTQGATLTYRGLLILLSECIGSHHISVAVNEMHPSKVISSEAVHYDLVKKVASAVYRANKCFHVNAPIQYEATMNALGQIHSELIQTDTTDIDQVSLMREIGFCAMEYFETLSSPPPNPDEGENSVSNSQVLRFTRVS